MRKLYWFQNDLRLSDNPGLRAQMDAEGLLLVYLLPVNRPWCNTTGMGGQRERFLRESLQSLQHHCLRWARTCWCWRDRQSW